MKIHNSYNSPAFKAVRFENGGELTMAKAYKDSPQEAKNLILRQIDNKYADIIVNQDRVSVVKKNYFDRDKWTPTGGAECRSAFKRIHTNGYFMEYEGRNKSYFTEQEHIDNMTPLQEEILDSKNPKPYRIFQIAEDIANDLEKKYSQIVNKAAYRAEVKKVKQLAAALSDLAEYTD